MSVAIQISAHSTRGRGWVKMRVVGEVWPSGDTQIRVLHWGHKKPYLGSKGWQVAEVWCDVEEMPQGEGETTIEIPPHITAMLEQGNNYRFSVRIGGAEVMDRAVLWKVSSLAKSLHDELKLDSKSEIDLLALTAQSTSGAPSPDVLPPQAVKLAEHFLEAKKLELLASDELAKAWEAAKLADTRLAYEQFLVVGGHYFDQAQHELAHFLPDQILLRTLSTKVSGPTAFRLDTCIFLLDAKQQVRNDRDFICWFAKEHVTGASLSSSACGAVINEGHSQPMQHALTSETIHIRLDALAADVCSVAVTLSLDPMAPPHRGLETVEFAIIEIVNSQTKKTLLEIDFAKGQFGIKGIYVAELVRRGNGWKLSSRDETFVAGLDAICARFGLAVE